LQEPLPLTTFQFDVVIRVLAPSEWRIEMGFSEADGLEMSLEYETVYEGGRNHQPLLLPKQVSYGKLTLRRGMTEHRHLWRWFEECQASSFGQKRYLRAEAEVTVKSGPAGKERGTRFLLSNCVPVRVKAPALNALTGGVAIEELVLGYETLQRLTWPDD